MPPDTAITVKHAVSTDHAADFPDLDGIDEFRDSLAEDYISIVKGRPAGAGGLIHLFVEVVSMLPLSHIVQLLIDGVAYDLIKEGSRSFILRPFISAYKRLKEGNRERKIDIGTLAIEFQDCRLIIHETATDTIIDNLEAILFALSQNYDALALESGELPFEIHVAVVEDPEEDRPCRFRVRGEWDETIRGNGASDYFGFWGLVYIRASIERVFDVKIQRILGDRFNTIEQHWRHLSWRAQTEARERQ
jgi:hypothetical protein